MLEKLTTYISALDTTEISEERKILLQPLINFIAQETNEGHAVHLNYICTHNSRRSHLGQIWGKVMARFCGIDQLHTYSGGTEATAFNPHAVEALRAAGMEVDIVKEGQNPTYSIRFSASEPPIHAWSKVFSDAVPEGLSYAALMTCSSADQGCPFIPEAKIRIPVTYEDPKKSDGTGKEAEVYGQRCRQIAAEMRYVMQEVKRKA
jgi:arsenate reductase (thioredoxin)